MTNHFKNLDSPVPNNIEFPEPMAAAPAATGTTVLDPLTIPKFVNPLPNLLQPGLLIDATQGQTYDISMSEGNHNFGLGTGIPSAKTWGYHSPSASDWDNVGLNYLGPTIVAQKDTPITVNWETNLPQQHLLPVDPTVHWAFTHTHNGQTHTIADDGVPVVTHLHGGHTPSQYDGLPDAWFTSTGVGGKLAINNGNVQSYTYNNDQEAGTLWYHDHALGITRLNVYAGLAGFYILRDDYDTGIPDHPKTTAIENSLPGNYINSDYTGDTNPDPDVYYEYPLVIQDKIFQADNPATPENELGQLFYPASNADLMAAGLKAMLPANAPNPSIVPEFASGNVILVNGQAWPTLNVEPRKYRFRLLNGSDSRFYNFKLPAGLEFTQIGTDDGLLNAPVKLKNLQLAPGQRADVVIDFAGYQGKQLILQNNAGGAGARPIPNNPQTTGQIMAFNVGNTVTVPDVPLPATLRGGTNQPPAITLPTSVSPIDSDDLAFHNVTGVTDPLTGLPIAKQVGLFEAPMGNTIDPYGRITPMLGTVKDGAIKWEDPITEKIQLGQTEVWEVYNTTADAHPVHLHGIPFQLLDRQKFSATQIDPVTGIASPTAPLTNIKFKGGPTPAAANEAGLLDTVIVNPGEVVRIAATFDLPGEYVWHCHILSHEDNEMMRPYEVISPPSSSSDLTIV